MIIPRTDALVKTKEYLEIREIAGVEFSQTMKSDR